MELGRKAVLCFAAGWVVISPLMLSACGGGGGAPDTGVTSPPPPPPPPSPPPPPPPPPPPLPTTPDPTSAEFQRSWGLAAIHADVAFNAGATGQGILIADVDTGANPDLPDLVGAISPLSTDIVSGRDQPIGTDPHADYVSSVLAARYNGFGTIGVAYEAQVLSIRADTGSNSDFLDSNLAAGIEYAVANHAQVINLSLGSSSPSGFDVQQALSDAVAAGIAIVVSAGNDGTANPEWPAQYATDPRYAGLLVAAGATTQSGVLASYSNQAGVAANGYLAAPGDNLEVACNQSNNCVLVSGTSFAAPHIAGSIALLLQAFPNLTAAQAVNILFTTADPAGGAGTNAVYGRGILDLTKAFEPVGTMSVATADGLVANVNAGGVTVTSDAPPAGGIRVLMTGAAFGDAIGRGQGLVTVGYDSYHRMFKVDLADAYQASPVQGLIAPDPAVRQQRTAVALPSGAELAFSSSAPLVAPQVSSADRGFEQSAYPASAAMEARIGGLTLTAWNGQGGAQPDLGEPRDAFQTIAAPNQVAAARFDFGRWALVSEGGSGQRTEPFASAPLKASSYVRFGGDYQGPDYVARIAFGVLDEPLGPLGSTLTGAFALPSATQFISLSGEKALPGDAILYADASVGRTRFDGLFLRADDAVSSSWRVGLIGACAASWRACSHIGLELAQPLRFETGDMTADLANAPARYFDPLTYSLRRIGVAPSGREVDLRVFADRDLRALGFFRLEATAASDEGQRSGAPLGLGVLGSWRYGF
jgi:hypothetical protein